MDCCPVTDDDFQIFTAEKVHLLILCKSGAIQTVTTGRGTKPSTKQLSERLSEFYMRGSVALY